MESSDLKTPSTEMTVAQLRAARAFLDWSMDDAAEAAGVTRRTVIRLEREPGYQERQPRSLERLLAVYRKAGVEFDRGGVRPADGSASPSGALA